MPSGSDPDSTRYLSEWCGVIPRAPAAPRLSLVTAGANAVFSNNINSPGQSDFPQQVVILTLFYVVGCPPNPREDQPLAGQTSL